MNIRPTLLLCMGLASLGLAPACLQHPGGPPDGSGGSPKGSGGAVGSGGSGPGSGGSPDGSGGTSAASGGRDGSGGTGTGSGGGGGGAIGSGGRGGGSGGITIGSGGRGAGGSGAGGSGAGGSGTGGAATGGRGTGGAGTGGAGTGGGQPTTCSLGNARNGNGSFTHYYFGQGSGREGNGYRLACGYFGTGNAGNGSNDMVQNIANPRLFAAIPGMSPTNFNTVGSCGACAEVTGQNGQRVIVTVVDQCPQSSNPVCNGNPNGHLDLSVQAFNMLGFPTGDPKNTSWRFVPCPVTGNIMVRIKSGNQNELFVEQVRVAVKSVEWNGAQASRTSYGAWHFNSNLSAGDVLNITDIANRSVTYTLAHVNQNVNQDTSVQFPACL